MKPDAQEAIVAIYRTMEKLLGRPPTNDAVFGAVRAMNYRFNDIEAKRILAKFRQFYTAAHPTPLLKSVSSAPQSEHDYTSNQQSLHLVSTATAPPSRAHNKVLPSPKDSPTGEVRETATGSKQTRTGQRVALPLDLENTVRSSEVLGLVWDRIKHIMSRSITKTEWGKRNRRVARDLATVGRTDVEIIAAFDSCVAKFGLPQTVKAIQTELGYLDAGPAKPRFSPPTGVPVVNIPRELRG